MRDAAVLQELVTLVDSTPRGPLSDKALAIVHWLAEHAAGLYADPGNPHVVAAVPTPWGRLVLEVALEGLLTIAATTQNLPTPVTDWLRTQARMMLLGDADCNPMDCIEAMLLRVRAP